jgi:hypothetical protein
MEYYTHITKTDSNINNFTGTKTKQQGIKVKSGIFARIKDKNKNYMDQK